jgi:hypothetical protein
MEVYRYQLWGVIDKTSEVLKNFGSLIRYLKTFLLKLCFMIYCSNCGKAIPDGSNFCTFCGAAIAVTDPQKPTITTPAAQPSHPVVANTSAAKNAFYTNPGFWGALVLLAGFLLPFYHEVIDNTDPSLGQIATNSGSSAGVYLFFLYPVASAVLIIQGFTYAFPPVIANLFKILPLLLLVFCFGAIMREGNADNSLVQFFKAGRIGMYAILVGSILVLFFRRKL